ncbi:2,3,4,5-tetrahydropyridine-2,6-dicarboxylate N-acetyltransferase [Pannonibacter phragmitetus]|uniref:2,3,4,5-tetrahydropyridine-2,6-dicarboxylate N-acetyltransferase n=1 Tax=Pannonibacter phragmitetus TaxID=121719 RepID=A0A378ZPG1_9HYPH|nr:acetyltransferase [Pannonibacter phragmitetus]SUA99146.1 2,3,4,5-tetrahydropyridine-2,6-dicarboxylate N-acetyltransferase [Pannonibacter phragmitetus]
MKLYGVYGASGFGREVMPLLRWQLNSQQDIEFVFVDDGGGPDLVNGHRCMPFDAFFAEQAEERAITIAIANSSVRSKLAKKCTDLNIQIIDVAASNSVIMDDVFISEGSIICPFVTITSNVKIGRHFHANIYSYIAHDCIVGDFVTLAPGVMCNGNVRIEDGAYVGAGAILRQGTPDKPLVIGAGSTVGMGAVVTRDVQPGSTVVGNPAKPLIRS